MKIPSTFSHLKAISLSPLRYSLCFSLSFYSSLSCSSPVCFLPLSHFSVLFSIFPASHSKPFFFLFLFVLLAWAPFTLAVYTAVPIMFTLHNRLQHCRLTCVCLLNVALSWTLAVRLFTSSSQSTRCLVDCILRFTVCTIRLFHLQCTCFLPPFHLFLFLSLPLHPATQAGDIHLPFIIALLCQ